MSNWVHNLPVLWMALVVFGGTYLVTAAIYAVIILLARGERARAFKAVSPGMLPPLGILFGLFVAFTAAQVWNDNERAEAAVNREASALRAILMLAASLRGEVEAQIRVLIGRHIEEAATREWPMMALTPTDKGQETAQRELVTALENALDARRQRIIVSQSEVNPVKWSCLFVQAVCALLAMGMVHSDNRLAAAITMGIFATGVATSVLLIAAHDRPFTGELSVGPDLLLQIMPGAESS
jgi:hypothetical protein